MTPVPYDWMMKYDALVAERDALAARLAEAEADYEGHLVYRHEWEAFDRWQRKAPAMERVVEAARVIPDLLKIAGAWTPEGEAATRALVKAEDDLRAALAELDGQTEPEAERAEGTLRGMVGGAVSAVDLPTTEGGRSGSVCPCRVHGDPDGDCGENCG